MHCSSHVRRSSTPFSRYDIDRLPSHDWDSSASLKWAVLGVIDGWLWTGSIDQDIGDVYGLWMTYSLERSFCTYRYESISTFCVRMSALMGDFQVPYGAEIGIVEYRRECSKGHGARWPEATRDVLGTPRSVAVNWLRELKQVTIHRD